MPEDLAVDYLVVSRFGEPPNEEAVLRGLVAAGLGAPEYTSRTGTASGGRQRAGAYHLQGGAASLRINVFRHEAPVTVGMAEAAFAALTRGLAPEDVQTLQQGTISLSVRVTSEGRRHDQSLDWAMKVIRVLLDLTQGAAIDPAAQRAFGRAEIGRMRPGDPLAHVAIHHELWGAESRWIHTHGLQKFGKPELDLVDVPQALEQEGDNLLREIAAQLAEGGALAAGGEIEIEGYGRAVAVGVPADIDHQAPYGRLRLCDVPEPGEPQQQSVRTLLGNMAVVEAQAQAVAGNRPGALEALDRALAADPDHCGALALRATLFLDAGQPAEALHLGELMELRVPHDYRGPLTVGQALSAMARYREALRALDRAILLEPEAAEAFAARAHVHERLGEAARAAEDRAHARYLRV